MSDKLSRLLHVLRREETHLNSEKDNSQDEQFSGTILRDNPEIKISTGIISIFPKNYEKSQWGLMETQFLHFEFLNFE